MAIPGDSHVRGRPCQEMAMSGDDYVRGWPYQGMTISGGGHIFLKKVTCNSIASNPGAAQYNSRHAKT